VSEVRANKVEAIRKFWETFRSCVEEQRVSPDRSHYYVKWAQAFVRFAPGKRLRERTGKDIEAFLVDLSKRPGAGYWQAKQAEHALKILYEVFLPDYVPVNSREDIQKPHVRKKVVPRTREDVFRDQVIPGEVERFFAPLISAMKTEIRSRHYSIRTESSYVDWVRRFIAFHDYADIKHLDAMKA
jgi:hypothetical protein